jgi:hypothetical protein
MSGWGAGPGWGVGMVRMGTAVLTTNVLSLPGVDGNFIATPDSPANSITSDIDMVMRVALADWTVQQEFANKFVSGGNRSWHWFVLSGGAIGFVGSDDGSSTAFVSSPVTGFAPGSAHWVRFTWRNSDNRAQFFTSDDDTNDPAAVTWTQLGTDQTMSLTGLHDGAAELIVGHGARFDIPSLKMTGYLYYFELRNGIGGAVAQSFDPTVVTPTGTRLPAAVAAGGPWTINGSNWDWAAV